MPELNFYHYRRSNVIEVDLIIENAGYAIPIEIKNSTKISKDWLKGINDFKEKSGKAYAGYAYVLSHYDQLLEIEPGIFNIPIKYLLT